MVVSRGSRHERGEVGERRAHDLGERALGLLLTPLQERHPQDSTQQWLARIARDTRIDTTALTEIVELHQRYRFDPIGLSAAQRALLTDSVDRWLATLAKAMDAERDSLRRSS